MVQFIDGKTIIINTSGYLKSGNIIIENNTIRTDSGNLTISSGQIALGNVGITSGTISGINDLSVSDGGTGASDAAGARTNLGLGTIATQNSDNVSITGGAIDGVSIGDTNVATIVKVDNVTIDGNSVSASNTNGILIVRPNGTGALQADSADDARGQYAIDLQRNRTSNDQVASGNYSVIGGGRRNIASGSDSTVSGGLNNKAIGSDSTVSGGRYNTASGIRSTVGGGDSNTASGYYSTVSGGLNNKAIGGDSAVGGGRYNTASGIRSTVGGGIYNTASGSLSTVSGGRSNTASGIRSTVGGGYNTASGAYSNVGGGRYNTASNNYCTVGGGMDGVASLYGEEARSSGKFNTQGDAQIRKFILRNKTTNNNIINLFLDGLSSEIIVPENSTWLYTVKIVGRDFGSVESAGYKIEGLIERNSLITLLLSEEKTILYEDNPLWDVNLLIDESGFDPILRISATVENGQNNVYWVAYVEVVQVIVAADVPSY